MSPVPHTLLACRRPSPAWGGGVLRGGADAPPPGALGGAPGRVEKRRIIMGKAEAPSDDEDAASPPKLYVAASASSAQYLPAHCREDQHKSYISAHGLPAGCCW
jgi:hypothetical protein